MYDQETGLYYLQNQYYNPACGRFINSDSLVDNTSLMGANQFAYCSNTPVNHKDPSGHFGIGALIGGLIRGISGAFSAAYNGDSVFAGFVTGAVSGAIMGLAAELCAEAAVIGALAYISCTVVCAATAGVFNIANQYWNYSLDKKTSEKSKKQVSNAYQNDELDNYPSFSNTIDKYNRQTKRLCFNGKCSTLCPTRCGR